MLRLGYTGVDITPSGSVETAGFNRKDNMSRGVLKLLPAQEKTEKQVDYFLQFVYTMIRSKCLPLADGAGYK